MTTTMCTFAVRSCVCVSLCVLQNVRVLAPVFVCVCSVILYASVVLTVYICVCLQLTTKLRCVGLWVCVHTIKKLVCVHCLCLSMQQCVRTCTCVSPSMQYGHDGPVLDD